MWFNGFMTVIDMALEALGDERLRRRRDALILGAFREDVCFVPGLDIVYQSPSLTHFARARLPGGFVPFLWPGAAQRTRKFFERALQEAAQGREAAACVQLGRAAHPLMDMACPVHAQGVAHSTDPFEWCVEAMDGELRRLPVPEVQGDVESLVRQMARCAQSVPADKTNSPWGAVMRRLGWRVPVRAVQAREQARVLIPQAAGCTAALFRAFLESSPLERADTAPPDLEMSTAGVRAWLSQLERFCADHGGARHYAGLLDLIGRCRAES